MKKRYLFVIDTIGGAYDINAQGVMANYPRYDIVIADVNYIAKLDLDKESVCMQLKSYDKIFMLAWWAPIAMNFVARTNYMKLDLPFVAIVGGHEQIRQNMATLLLSYKKVYAVSDRLVDELDGLGISAEFLAWFYDPVVFYRKDVKIDNSKFVVGWVGNSSRPVKQFDLFRDLCSAMKSYSWFEPKMAASTLASNENGMPYMDKDVSVDKMGDFYRSLDCFVVTSLSEGQPKTAIEAALCGVPILSPDIGVCRELGAFILPSPLSIESLSIMLHRMYARPEWCQIMGDASLAAARRIWGTDNVRSIWNKILT